MVMQVVKKYGVLCEDAEGHMKRFVFPRFRANGKGYCWPTTDVALALLAGSTRPCAYPRYISLVIEMVLNVLSADRLVGIVMSIS